MRWHRPLDASTPLTPLTKPSEILTKIESRGLWSYFHKDWLIQIRDLVRPQLPRLYAVFVESEALAVAPADGPGPSPTAPDLPVARRAERRSATVRSTAATQAVVEIEEPYELLTTYSLLIRRAPEQRLVAACELLSPTNKAVLGPVYRDQHLRNREQYLAAGVSLLEIDALLEGQRILPEQLTGLRQFARHAWTVAHGASKRTWRGWGWNEPDVLPVIAWDIEEDVQVSVDLARALEQALRFNPWEDLAPG